MLHKISIRPILLMILLLTGMLLTARSLPVSAATDVQFDFESGGCRYGCCHYRSGCFGQRVC